MTITLLKSKIHRATITDSNLHYEGSIAIAPGLVERAGLCEYEKVLVANINNGNRFETYVIAGEEGRISLNGAAAHLGKPGDKVIIMAWAALDESERAAFAPKIILVGDDNRPKGE